MHQHKYNNLDTILCLSLGNGAHWLFTMPSFWRLGCRLHIHKQLIKNYAALGNRSRDFSNFPSPSICRTLNADGTVVVPEVQSKPNGIDYLSKLIIINLHFSIKLAGGSSNDAGPITVLMLLLSVPGYLVLA